MASVTSLGTHTPSALPFLVAEGILPSDPRPDTYVWKILWGDRRVADEDEDEDEEEEEELLTTKYCVVWSRGAVLQRVFRFDVEGEPITQAVFANFPNHDFENDGQPKHHSVSNQHDWEATTANGELKVGKQRASSSQARLDTDLNAVSDNDGRSKRPSQVQNVGNNQRQTSRALLVVLKSQAHVFFLSRTSHVVHLPFEVDAVFPSIYGALLQRKLPETDRIPPTPQLPSVPNNTFAFSQVDLSRSTSKNQSYHTLANSTSAPSHDSPLSPLLKDLLYRSRQAPEMSLPRLYSLTDPFAEIGTVAAKTGPRLKGSQRASPVGNLDVKEHLLYVSSKDELCQPPAELSASGPLALAVTEHQETGALSVWTVTYIDNEAPKALRGQASLGANSTMPRRRSSHAPGMTTGSTTPVARGTAGGRESFGGERSLRHTSTGPTLDESSTRGQDDPLGSAFVDQTIPGQSLRRISGLLARADLSTSHDKLAFNDLVGAHAGKKSGRKGASFGAPGARLSTGLDTAPVPTKPQTLHGIRTSFDSVSLYEAPFDEIVDELDEFHDRRRLSDGALRVTASGLRKEVTFTKIYSMPRGNRPFQYYDNSPSGSAREITTIKRPNSSLGDASGDAAIIMCIIDRTARELLVLHIRAYCLNTPTKAQNATTVHGNAFGAYGAHVTGMTRRPGVVDACKVGDGAYSRILVLDSGSDGMGELSLQAPWSCLRKIELPPTLCLHNPYQIASDATLRRRREGSFKRVLSRGPQALTALQHPSCRGRVDVVSSDGVRHRLQIQFRPRNALVWKMIRVVEAIMPASEVDGETILRGWWDAMSFLQGRSEEDINPEWTAMVVILFSMGVSSIGDRITETTTRQKRRKGGLLRSSSGANTDLESWEAMITQEGNSSGASPAWSQVGAWEWTGRDSILPHTSPSNRSRLSSLSTTSATATVPVPKKSPYLLHCISLAREFIKSPVGQKANGEHGYLPTALSRDPDFRRTALASILVGLHLLREEFKLDMLAAESLDRLTPILAQIGTWLNWDAWGSKDSAFYMLEGINMEAWLFEDSRISALRVPPEPFPPPSILHFLETANLRPNSAPFVTLLDVANSPQAGVGGKCSAEASAKLLSDLMPRTVAITNFLSSYARETREGRVAKMASLGLSLSFLETLPEGVAVSLRTAISACEAHPSRRWDSEILKFIGREDIAILEREKRIVKSHRRSFNSSSNDALRDVHGICHSALEVEAVGPYDGSAELDRQAVTRLLFSNDQRFAEAAKLVHPLLYPTARCAPEPEWSDTELLEAQQELAKVIATRTLSVSPGRGLLFYSARLPLLTEKFPVHGFTLSCVMKPTDTTVTADRNLYTEEKTSWAFFHAGVEAGLSISKYAKGIDTSWILFNKPRDLTNRHAGFLLALGLNGHLRRIAKWVAFKYLTPKHTMTSIGLLLGLSASYLGTMDTLITRLLSVHVTRMLPPGAAELNLSPLTQTSGIMGIGLLYCNTQHRRMSEIMLSEMENIDQEDSSNPLENLRDEGYRLAAGFALGYINLGMGKRLVGLQDMHITERLLVIAIGTKKVDKVHILDKATAAATVAIALIFMKTQDESLARKIDIPDTLHQFDYVRPDLFLLRTVARHLIMWDSIKPNSGWMKEQLPLVFQQKHSLNSIRTLTSEDMPFFNIVAGLCLSIGLRFAGSGCLDARNLLCHYIDQYMRICKLPTLSYDGKLARITVRNCQDVIVLAACCVMAGTGDLHIFRRLRSLHGRTDGETPFGSHLAAHFAIGVLFMGGGTYTFGTSNLATASLLCALFPLFPNAVLDNKSHLQAFRHFWVLAADRRCLVPRDVDTHRPVALPILVTLLDGTKVALSAPCLLPQLQTIASIQTNDKEFWSVSLDFAENSRHREAFERHQSIYVRRRAAYDAHTSIFSATMQALNDTQSTQQINKQAFKWIFNLPALASFDRAEQTLVLPADARGTVYRGTNGTVVDDRLMLEKACMESGRSERLWNLRILFAWADGLSRRGEEGRWLGMEIVEGLRARLAMKRRQTRTR